MISRHLPLFHLVSLSLLLAFLGPRTARAQCANPVACENALPGTPQSVWDPGPPGLHPNPSIRGFTDEISYNKGELVRFYVQTPDADGQAYSINIYRLGYYPNGPDCNGACGARFTAGWSGVSVLQPACSRTPAMSLDPATDAQKFTELIDCGNWNVAWSWQSPANLVSGLYMAKLSRGSVSAPVFFIIRDDARNSDILLQTSDTTWHAYNTGSAYQGGSIPTGRASEGRSLYDVNKPRAFKVSYRRPHRWETTNTQVTPNIQAADDITSNLVFTYGEEYSLIRFLERNGYDVTYFSGRDADQRGNLIANHRLFITSGHDEYWSRAQMYYIESARDAGTSLAFFSGNTAFWEIRWEDDYHTMVTYKEASPLKLDPAPGYRTATFRDLGFPNPLPENHLTGLLTSRPSSTEHNLSVPEADGKMRFWRNTSVATLAPGTAATFGHSLLGFEIDGDADNSYRPAGLFNVSTTEVLDQPIGSGFELGHTSAMHNMTLYRASSGAFVFHAGTMRLQRALAGFYNKTAQGADARLQQAIVNLFADMNVQPATLQSGIIAASASTDTTAPTAQINFPTGGSTVDALDTLVVSGAASDIGGRVAAVEVSTDGGTTWHPASGRTHWSYSFTPCTAGAISLAARAVDDSGLIGAPSPTTSITAQTASTIDFAVNGKFDCGFDPAGAGGARGTGWFDHANSGTTPQYQNAGKIPGVNMQRVVASGAGDGVGQHVTLIPGKPYLLRARVFAESGAAILKIGKHGQADDVSATTTLARRWQTLSVHYMPAQAACTFVVYSHGGASTFKVDDVRLIELSNLIPNGDFSGGFQAINDAHGVGQRAASWWHWSNSGRQATYSSNTLIPGNPMQHVTLSSQPGSYADGVGQHFVGTLSPNTTYTLNARVFAAAGTVQMKIGQLFAANDQSISTSSIGTWQNLTLTYATGPSQTSASIAFYGVAPGTQLYLDDVSLTVAQ